jgi:hypothetical protein
MTKHVDNSELSSDPFDQLIARIEQATRTPPGPAEQLQVARALQLVSQEIVKRYKRVNELQEELETKLANATAMEMAVRALDLSAPPPAARAGWIRGRSRAGH